MTTSVMLTRSKRFSEPLRGIVDRLQVGGMAVIQEDCDLLNTMVFGGDKVAGCDCRESTMLVP